MQRTLVNSDRPSESIAPGVTLERLGAGGKAGPQGETLADLPGGQIWSDIFLLGDPTDAFQVTVPDLRMPPNQYWPLHWHDCWIAIVVLEGRCLVGDWWMGPGDVLITEAGLEYGPLLIGPQGCRLFEIFAKHHLQAGGYAPEYRDHPTLQGTHSVFAERTGVNTRNAGRQTLPLEGVAGVAKGRLEPGARFDLGAPDARDRAVLLDTRLAPAERIPVHAYDDWRAIIVFEGEVSVAGHRLEKDAFLLIRPDSRTPEIQAGPFGAQLFEVARTPAAVERRAC
ncbi:hypothetical protein LJR219_003403 [Phenylobacterium sp. LjRoot219]|uniref:cupin domain-containing protein n=1 Tax=Phenylobacterium sp. LjRoot219 TaxID=3342283 RepID=UPI003ECF3EEF